MRVVTHRHHRAVGVDDGMEVEAVERLPGYPVAANDEQRGGSRSFQPWQASSGHDGGLYPEWVAHGMSLVVPSRIAHLGERATLPPSVCGSPGELKFWHHHMKSVGFA